MLRERKWYSNPNLTELLNIPLKDSRLAVCSDELIVFFNSLLE